MNQNPVAKEIIDSLTTEGYAILPLSIEDPRFWLKYCFDIAARREFHLLMIKIFSNIDKIPIDIVDNLKLISYYLKGVPLIIGEKTRSENDEKGKLRENVVYERRGIPALNLNTFKTLIKNNKLFTISRKGGFFVKVDGEKLHQLRTQHGLSFQEVASQIGVSRKAVYLFERMEMIKEENLLQLEKVFEESFKISLDIFNWEIPKAEVHPTSGETEYQAEVKENLEDLGFNTYWAKKAPFDGITSETEEKTQKPEESCLITGLGSSIRQNVTDKIRIISEISKLAHRLSMFIIEGGKIPSFDNVLVLQKENLDKMRSDEELFKALKKVKRVHY